ncbi:hypothetical protein OTU49_017184 [Cherax quadricarinatus]|uniref:BZIP domain-containing protein n=1 Tax=Cherax quadricarinatus TaxID=27406 RepID=A0AAW0XR06_CHEQU
MFGPASQPSQEDSDSQQDKKKLKAHRSRQARLNAKKYEEYLRITITDVKEQVEKLKKEKQQLIEEITVFEDSLSRLQEQQSGNSPGSRLLALESTLSGEAATNKVLSVSSVSCNEDFQDVLPGTSSQVPCNLGLSSYDLSDASTDNSWWDSSSDVSSVSACFNVTRDTPQTEPSLNTSTTNNTWNLLQQETEHNCFLGLSSMSLEEPAPPLAHQTQTSTGQTGCTSLLPTEQDKHIHRAATSKQRSSERRKSTKVFSYLLPPQENPQQEIKRQRAVRAHQQRQEEKSQHRELQMNIQKITAEVESLKTERQQILKHLERLHRQYNLLTSGSFSLTSYHNKP